MATARFAITGILTVGLLFLITTFSGVSAQPAPSPAPDCTNNLLNLSDCLTYVEAGSNLTKPEKGCCPALSDLVANSPICLCQLLSDPNALGIPLNLKKALGLPAACRVSTPPVSLCAALGIPVGAPTPSESPMSPGGSMLPSGPTAAPLPKSKNAAASSRSSAFIIFLGFSSLVGAILF